MTACRLEVENHAGSAPVDDHDVVVVTKSRLRVAVDAAFAETGDGLAQWPDPHLDRSPRNEEYSRLTNPGKWRIIGARADAWLIAIADLGLAEVERGAPVRWRREPGPMITGTDLIVPFAKGALTLVVARSQLATIADAGILLGVGDPVGCVTWVPGCGCDACDSGSQNELDELDAHILGVVSGAFRRLSAGNREITVIGEGGWSASNLSGRDEVDTILDDPKGWDEISGASWLNRP